MNAIERIGTTAVVAFDYDTLAPEIAAEARAAPGRINERIRAYQGAIIEAGRDLLAIKERLEHGSFLAWIEAEFGMTGRTAQNYMMAASVFGDKCETVSYLPPTT